MSYRPARVSGLGAHVAGRPAFVLLALLGDVSTSGRLGSLPPEVRAETLEVLDNIRGAAAMWTQSRKEDRDADNFPGAGEDPAHPLESFLTTGQAADALGVSERRVRQLADAGTLAGRKLGRQWQLDPESVQARRLAEDVA